MNNKTNNNAIEDELNVTRIKINDKLQRMSPDEQVRYVNSKASQILAQYRAKKMAIAK
jgi:hypothetical protein